MDRPGLGVGILDAAAASVAAGIASPIVRSLAGSDLEVFREAVITRSCIVLFS